MAGKARTNAAGQPNAELLRVKRECGKALMERRKVFTALQRNVSKEGNLAEQHLIDMLCTRWVVLRPLLRWHLTHSARISSGFSRDDEWGYRALEPSRCCISSISLVLLNTGIEHGGSRDASKTADSETDSEDEDLKAKTTMGDAKVTLDDQQMNTAQKLLLFWRKPAVSASDILVRRVCSDVMVAAKMLVGWRRSGYSRGRGFQGECKDQSLGETGVDARVELGMSFQCRAEDAG